jgi:ATP-binding cassette subfamily F protein 3
VKVLSGGERSRLAMVKLLLAPVNLLVLDEPTNHLDMRSKDILKQALINYDGTLVIVSHDREFLDGLVHKVYEFRNHKIKEHIGGIYEFLEKRKIENLAELERKTKLQPGKLENRTTTITKIDYSEKKEYDKSIRKLNQQIADAEQKISLLETEMVEVSRLLSQPGLIEKNRPESLYIRHGELEKLIESEMIHWEQLNAALQKMKDQRI